MTTVQPVSNEELDQIIQTTEMFEVILQSNPEDCQSMEILKEAYWKLGRQKEALAITRKLADTYYAQGQFSSAMLEYEGILQKEPQNAEVKAKLGEVEAKLNPGAQQPGETAAPFKLSMSDAASGGIAVDFAAAINDDPTLITTNATVRTQGVTPQYKLDGDGNDALAKFLIQHKLAAEDVVRNSLERVKKLNHGGASQSIAPSLIQEISRSGMANLELLLSGILDRSKFAYIPLEYYDVDRQIVRMLPETLTLGRLIVPFDLVSRTIMVAVANPFDAQGKEAVQTLLDYNIQWHLASPAAITKVLRETYRVDARD